MGTQISEKEIYGVAEKSTIVGFQQSVSVPFFCHDILGACDFISISEYVKYMNDKLLDFGFLQIYYYSA